MEHSDFTTAHVGGALILNVSNRCNLRCRFCYEQGCRVGELPSFDAIVRSLRQHPPGKITNLMFMGAETFLRTDVLELVRAVREQGIPHIGVATNGTLLRNRRQVRELLEAGLDNLELSIHTLDPEHAAYLSGRDFTYERQQRALSLLHDLGREFPLQVTINTVLCDINLEDFLPLMQGIEKNYPGLEPIYHLKYPYTVEELLERVKPATHSKLRSSGMLAALPEGLRPRVVFEFFPLCALAPHFELCCELIGLGLDRTLEYVLTLPDSRDFSQDFALGRSCELDPRCDECTVRLLCPGFPPGYGALVAAADCCAPLSVAPEQVLAQVASWRRAHGLPVTLELERPEVAQAVLERAVPALERRLAGAGMDAAAAQSENPVEELPRFLDLVDRYWGRKLSGGGPPSCCAASADCTSEEASDRAWALLGDAERPSWLMNVFLAGTPFRLFEHLPCSLQCPATRDQASVRLERLAEDPEFHDHVRRLRAAPVLYTDIGGRAFLFSGDVRDGVVHYREVYPGSVLAPERLEVPAQAHRALLGELYQTLREGDRVSLAGDRLTVRQGNRILRQLDRPPELRWKLLEFV
ncbi:MAG: radical SAM protein [bacterium]